MFFYPVEIWAASALSRTEERHHSVAGVRQQLDGAAGAPGSPYWEPGAHVTVWDQRMESLQRVCDSIPLSATYVLCNLFDWLLTTPHPSSFSNLAFMIEMAQKELQKFRWGSDAVFQLQEGCITVRVDQFYIFWCTGSKFKTWTGSVRTISWQEEPNCESWSQSMSSGDFVRWRHCAARFPSVLTSVSTPNSWVSLVSKNYEIERAIVQLENEMTQLRQQQGDENKENIRQDF